MSPIGSEHFRRLEEFPPFISCIKCFGKPIIPPLVTSSTRSELKELQIAAVRKEAENLRRKNELLNQRQEIDVSSKTYGDECSSGFESSVPVQESCALWYPSIKDFQGRNSVAISKLPTSGIYISVHTGAIVCPNLNENCHSYTDAATRNSQLTSGANLNECVECSHNNIDLGCSQCQEECNQSFHNESFATALNSEVPCITSLQQQDVRMVNFSVEETDCESLPTVICNKKCVPLDTDTESYITCISQSTDLDKYMEFSHELSSPDNSVLTWDSKSASQQFTLSKSDDASSETIVNTENELTPCASTLAELTDNIEDELSNADETAAVSDRETTLGRLKRSHSMDSCMKILQNCAKSANVKKSLSEPLNTGLKIAPDAAEAKIPLSLKTSFLIKEDSKESEESKDMQEKDVSDQGDGKISKNDKNSNIKINNNSFHKKHIRQNSYTLDEPSSALILAHADCTCKLDADLSPHCSALKNENEVTSNSAFVKEKVEVDIPVSYQMKKISMLSPVSVCESIISNKEDMTSAVIDVFPVVEEDSCEKSNSGNVLSEVLPSSTSVFEINSNPNTEEEHLNKMFSENFNISEKNKDYLQLIYQELQKSHEMQLIELLEQQNLHWLKLKEEFKETERLLYEKIKLTILDSPSNIKEKDQINKSDYCKSENTVENASTCEKDLSISNSTISSNQTPTYTSDNFSIQNLKLPVPVESFQPAHSQTKDYLSKNTRASVSPSRKCRTPNISPSKPFENIKGEQIGDSSSSLCNFERNENYANSNSSKLLQNINGFSSTTTSNLPHCNIPAQPPNIVTASSNKKCDNIHTCFCDKSVKQFKDCTSPNGCCECDISNSHPECKSSPQEENSISNSNKNGGNGILHSQASLLTSCVQSKDFINGHDINNYKNVLPISSQKSNDYIFTSLDFSSKELPSVDYDKNVLPQAFLKQNDLSVTSTSVISSSTKTLKNGSVAQDVISNKTIMNDPNLLKKFEKLPAFVKGYLTRRLFKTERMQCLFQTFQDTGMLIKKLEDDLSRKNGSISEKDLTFRKQLYIQLWATFYDVHNILSEISVKKRMAIIAESRDYRLRQRTLNHVQQSSPPVITKAPESAPLSSATLKYLARKRSGKNNTSKVPSNFHRSRSTIEMKICTIDGLDHSKGRACTSLSSKSLSASPSSIYNTSVACRKRRTASAKSSGSHQGLHHQKQVS